MDFKKYTHRVKIYSDKWLKKPNVVEVTLPYIKGAEELFVRPDKIAESYQVDMLENKKNTSN